MKNLIFILFLVVSSISQAGTEKPERQSQNEQAVPQTFSQNSTAQQLYLICNFQWSTGLREYFDMDLSVDLRAGTVNGENGEITPNSIRFQKYTDSGGMATIHVSRRSGSASFLSEKVGSANGSCSASQGAKF